MKATARMGWAGLCLGGALLLGGCLGSSGDSDEAVVIQGEFPVVFASRDTAAVGNPTDAIRFRAGGDLMLVDLASPSAPLQNLTATYTQGEGDVSDPDVSFDGTRVLFSMRGPGDPTWNLFEYTFATGTLRRVIADDALANAGDDVDPAYLPDGRIVFSSNRQERTKALLAERNIEPYTYVDEYERERVTVLHVMDADGTDVRQISFNQSHDRNPSVLMTGEIMFARWDHVGNRNHFPIFFTNPDGTNIFVQYGAFSPGNSFLHPREMPDGRVMSTLMPLSGTHEGGALMAVDIRNFSEASHPVPGAPDDAVGQQPLTLQAVDFGMRDGVATYGRYTTPYPLWDGTNRALVSWTPSRPVTVQDPLTGEDVQTEGPPLYGVYIFDLDDLTLRPIRIPPEGRAYTDPVPVMARPVPNSIPDKPLDAGLAARGVGVLNVKSVYDTDFLDIMGRSVLAPDEDLPMTSPPPDDTRSQVPDLMQLKDPALTTAAARPGRFLRVTEAVPTPRGISRQAIGETTMEMQQIVGYTEVEPDGSVRIEVPADTPLTMAVLDADGLAFQVHTNWLQVRPGETRTCNGCHSPRRGSALNSAPIAGFHPNTVMTAEPGESMAETRTRLDPDHRVLREHLHYVDAWTDSVMAGRAADPSFDVTYDALQTPAPVNGIINFPEHVAPIFSADRGDATCTGCHDNNLRNDPLSAGLDLRATPAGTGRVRAYESLMVGAPVLDPDTGLPQLRVRNDGSLEVVREPALVRTGGRSDSARSSRLMAKLLERPLRNSHSLSPATVDHRDMLNASELRVIAEWIDVGGQYFNDPFDVDDPFEYRSLDRLRRVRGLSERVFEDAVHPMLMQTCAGCHQPFSGSGTPDDPGNPSWTSNRYVLTGSLEGDLGASLSMVADVCQPAYNALTQRPISDELGDFPHPRVADRDDPNGEPVSVLSPADAEWQLLSDWIATGECT